MQLILDTKNLTLAKKNGIFHVFNDKSERVISPGKLTSIAITANVRIDSSAILLAIKHEVPILFLDAIGRPQARIWRPYFSSISTLRRQQVYFADQPAATAWMIDIFEIKTAGQVAVLEQMKSRARGVKTGLTTAIKTLRTNSRNLEAFRETLLAQSSNQIMGVEGGLARVYWSTVGSFLPRPFRFHQRSRRPAKDVFNAALNYWYGMLYTIVEGGVLASGLDPQLGFLHADAYNKPTLVFDLIEPFRPWIDELLVDACFTQAISPKFFTKNQYGLFLNKEGKQFCIPLFNKFLRTERDFLGSKTTARNHIHGLCQKLANRIRSTFE